MNMERTTVKLGRLIEGKDINPRADAKKISIGDLMASIAACGLIYPLLVKAADKDGFYIVGDGNRRLKALKKNGGKVSDDVPVIVLQPGEDFEEASLMGNVTRLNLHPVDEYRAYKKLIDRGSSVIAIAQRFGQTNKWVMQRLQLARVHPDILEDWRLGNATAEQIAALSATADQAKQLEVWKDASKHGADWLRRPDNMRAAVAAKSSPVTSGGFIFVGAEAYEAAGGRYADDLFVEAKRAIDVDILSRLSDEMIEVECVRLMLNEKWAWAASSYATDRWRYTLIDLTPWADERELAAFEAGYYAKSKAELAIIERIKDDPEIRARAGVLVSVDKDGAFAYETFLLKEAEDPEDDPDEDGEPEDGNPDLDRQDEVDASQPKAPEEKVNYALRESLSEILTMAVSQTIGVASPDVPLAFLLACLRVKMFGMAEPAPLQISTEHWPALVPGEAPGSLSFVKELAYALASPNPHGLIAVLVAFLMDLRWPRYDRRMWRDSDRRAITQVILRALEPYGVMNKMRELYDPNVMLKRLTSAQLTAILKDELGFKGPIPALKKTLVELTAGLARDQGWLPKELRIEEPTDAMGADVA
jgi:ParB/RepB/Spo0J family partition protein